MYLYIRTMPMANLWQDEKWCSNIELAQVCQAKTGVLALMMRFHP